MSVDIGGDGAWRGAPAGGVASVNGFNLGYTTAFVFPAWLANGTPRYTAEAAAHESGHGFGLEHQSEYSGTSKVQEYSDNDPSTTGNTFSAQAIAPIMGVSYYSTRGQWWSGTNSISSGTMQNDMEVLSTNNGFGYRPDDFPSVTTLAVNAAYGIDSHGIIEQKTDSDSFSFHATGGIVEMSATVNPENPMLDISLSLLDSSNAVIASSVTSSLSEFLHTVVTPGDYTVRIAGAGNYGDVGQWYLHGFVAPEPSIIGLMGMGMMLLRRRR
jgi:hypothetical protein